MPVAYRPNDRIVITAPAGSTVVPIIGLSDQTHLTNCSGDKKAWPVYMTIGNMLSQTRSGPAKMSVLLVVLLPVPPKLTSESRRADETQQQINADSLRAVFDLDLTRCTMFSVKA